MGPRAVMDVFEKKKISCPYQDSNYGLSSPTRGSCKGKVTPLQARCGPEGELEL